MNENLIAEIEKTFAETSELKNVKTTPCRISFKGQFVTLASGKTIWRNESFARSALLNHFKTVSHSRYLNLNEIPKDTESIKKIIQQLEEAGILRFVKSDITDYASSPKY